jgi:uncharacterized membrane protein
LLTLLNTAPWMEVIGRAHVALVHFPIALLAAAMVFELVRIVARGPKPSAAAIGCLLMGTAGGAAAIASGWIHADAEGHAGDVAVEWHRWVGIVGLVLALAARAERARAARRGYVLAVALAAGLAGFAGHQGGELVWGKGYLFAPLSPAREPATDASPPPPALLPPVDVIGPVSFTRDLLPVFEAACIECHGERKQNGDLRLDTLDELIASPYVDEVVVAGDADASTLYQRIILDEDHRDFMPKRGKPLPTATIDLVRRWIEESAADELLALPPPAAPSRGLLGPEAAPPAQETNAAVERAIGAVASRGGYATRAAEGDDRLIVNLSVLGRAITIEDVQATGLCEVFEFAAAGVQADDAIAAAVAALPGLARVDLGRSRVGDAGAAALAAVPTLRVMTLYDTALTDAAIDALIAMPSLERIYLGQTAIGADALRALSLARPDLTIIHPLAPSFRCSRWVHGAMLQRPSPTRPSTPPLHPPSPPTRRRKRTPRAHGGMTRCSIRSSCAPSPTPPPARSPATASAICAGSSNASTPSTTATPRPSMTSASPRCGCCRFIRRRVTTATT